MTKTCRDCGVEKPADKFNRHKGTRDRLNSYCRECDRARARAWAVKNRDRVSTYGRRAHLLATYGITLETYDEMLAAQGGVCLLCGREPAVTRGHKRLVVDHDHESGKVRGLLCSTCNMALHSLDSYPGWLDRAVEYVAATRVAP